MTVSLTANSSYTAVKTPFDAATRFLYQCRNRDSEGFAQSLNSEAVYSFERKYSVPPTGGIFLDPAVIAGVFKAKLFDITTEMDIKEWSVKCAGLTATCDYVVDEKKDDQDPAGLNGHYKMVGTMVFSFVRTEGDLKISKIWESTQAIKLD